MYTYTKLQSCLSFHDCRVTQRLNDHFYAEEIYNVLICINSAIPTSANFR